MYPWNKVEKEIKKSVSRIIEYTSTSDTFENINFELDENDLKKYLESVIGELKNSKNKWNLSWLFLNAL